MNLFIQHKTIANILMSIVLIFGFFSLTQLNLQFWPDVAEDIVLVTTKHENSSPKKVDDLIAIPIESSLRHIEGVNKTYSYSEKGLSKIFIEYDKKMKSSEILNKIQSAVQKIDLPDTSTIPKIEIITNTDVVARIIFSYENEEQIDINVIQKYKTELLNMGMGEVHISGFGNRNISININKSFLLQEKITTKDISDQLSDIFVDSSIGKIGAYNNDRTLIVEKSLKNIKELEGINLTFNNKKFILSDISDISFEKSQFSTDLFHNQKISVELILKRGKGDGMNVMASILNDWYENTNSKIPPYMDMKIYSKDYKNINERNQLFFENAALGFLLVLILLFLVLHWRLAIWVAMGIPVSFCATFILMEFLGLSINVLTLFGLIMAIGIVIDDAIVIAEQTLKELENGKSKKEACYLGAKKMFIPVIAASLTTIAAFIPLWNIEGQMGDYLSIIPVVITCVIAASLIEAFLILPAHLYMSVKNLKEIKKNNKFNHIFIKFIKKTVLISLKFRKTTISLFFLIFIGGIATVATGFLNFEFFPETKDSSFFSIIEFEKGIKDKKQKHFIKHLEKTFLEMKLKYPDKIDYVNTYKNVNMEYDDFAYGAEFVSMKFAYFTEDKLNFSSISDEDFVNEFKNNITIPSYIKKFSLNQKNERFNQTDIEFNLSSENSDSLSKAVEEVKLEILKLTEVEDVKVLNNSTVESWSISLTKYAIEEGLNNKIVSEQMEGLLSGDFVTSYLEGEFSVNVFVKLEESYINNFMRIEDLPITFNNNSYRIGDIVTLNKSVVSSMVTRIDGLISLPITVVLKQEHKEFSNTIFTKIEKEIIPNILNKYYISYELYGESYSEDKTLISMIKYGLFGIALIYLILSIVFNSYKLPIIIMSIIPFALSGALWGHLLMDYNLSILSIFSIFGLGGIVVNSSIVLIHLYKENLEKHKNKFVAIYLSVTERIRPILLTTLTTIIGLLPLLLNKQAEADFLIPMAISMVFGIAFSFLVIIYLLPAFLALGSKHLSQSEIENFINNGNKRLSYKKQLIKLAKINYKKGLIKKQQYSNIHNMDENDVVKMKQINELLKNNINQQRG
jgi:multidrug efflux pump subunit AcrB